MLRNFIKIAWRNLVNHRFYSAVNILGLSSGIAFSMLIAAYVWSELQVNARLKHAPNQYIIQSKWKDPNQGLELTTLGPLAKELKEQYPNLVADYCRWDGITSIISKGDKSFREGIQICDSTMLHMYGFGLLHGNSKTAFEGPYSVVITADKANRYFGKTDVVGETISIENFSGSKHDFVVTGVLEKPYRNSVTWITDDNDNQVYISTRNLGYFGRNMTWNNQYIVGYVELKPGVAPAQLEGPMLSLVKQQAPQASAAGMIPYIVPLNEYYLSANNGLIKRMLFVLAGIAFFILLMAIVNFVNLSVSRSASRMREVGMRKVMGGRRKQLILQFLIESTLIVSFATILALVIYAVANSYFAQLLGKPLPGLNEFPIYFLAWPLLLIFSLGFFAGIYPAFVLSALRSVDSLKGKLPAVSDKIILRKSLVTFQFSIATIVLISAFIISQQIDLFFSKDLGYNKDYIITTQLPRNWSPEGIREMESVRKQFATLPQVKEVSISFEVPDGNSSGNVAIFKAGADSTTAISSQLMMTDEYYAAAYGMKMAAGEFYCQPGAFTDSSKIVINETQAKALGWNDPRDAIGKQVVFQGSGGFASTIAGVTKDFHFGSLHKAIPPVTFVHVGVTKTYRMLSLKINAGNTGETIETLQQKWSAIMPGVPFDYKFLDETIRKLYKIELQLRQASYTATVLAIIIVLLGILGLVSLNIQKRTKEIGIRKVLGASVQSIIALFVKEFIPLMIVAALVACPVAYLVMDQWLQDYVYKIDITATPFFVSAIILALITALLIVLQTLKAAMNSPAESLKTE